MCPNRNLGQINRKQGVEAAASLRLGLRGSLFAPGVAGGVGICACCALAPPKLNPKLSRINCKLQLYRLWFNPTWIYGCPLRGPLSVAMGAHGVPATTKKNKWATKCGADTLSGTAHGVPATTKKNKWATKCGADTLSGTANFWP